MSRQRPPRPLDDIRVLELGAFLAGPFCGQLLADFGAEVIKVEPPGKGDPMREWGRHRYKGRTLWWPVLARNKKSITIDLRTPEGQALVKRIVPHVDMVLENFRPGTLEEWGLGWEELSALNPGLIMIRVSGFGQTGPYRDKAGFGSIGEAMGGIRAITGFPTARPPASVSVSAIRSRRRLRPSARSSPSTNASATGRGRWWISGFTRGAGPHGEYDPRISVDRPYP